MAEAIGECYEMWYVHMYVLVIIRKWFTCESIMDTHYTTRAHTHTLTSHGSGMLRLPGKKIPQERSWKTRLRRSNTCIFFNLRQDTTHKVGQLLGIHMYMRTHIHTYVHTYIHKYIHTYIHTYICAYILKHMPTMLVHLPLACT